MKKTLLLFAALFASIGLTTAQTLTIPAVEILPGGTASFELVVDVPANSYAGFQFETSFPTGITYTENTTVSPEWKGEFLTSASNFNCSAKGLIVGGKLTPIPSGERVIATAEITADASLALDEYNVTISNFEFLGYSGGAEDTKIADVTFKVIVTDRITLNETATVAPVAATDVNVKVKRTINANTWSTICLPFAMDENQVKAAFGNDVVLGDFKGYDAKTENDEVTSITVNFDVATAIEANHPYIIYVGSRVETFTVDGVDVDPAEDPRVHYGGKKVRNDFVGTYVADFDFYDNAKNPPLFLSGNKFYYATDKTKHLKAYRAYFDFDDCLPEAEGSSSGARIMISFDEGSTKIDARTMETIETGKVYNMSGQYVGEAENIDRLPKGIYIVNGKKKVVK